MRVYLFIRLFIQRFGLRREKNMGYLLKEALKSLCGLNQWAYALFWKIGCQNPKLLIWEDCYFETAADSLHLCLSGIRNEQLAVQAGNKVSTLINRMMKRNQVNIVGEGMVGRAAFTGKHQWILSENYLRDAHPPEVQNEVSHQYSAGMQTIAVIPVLPHGVVQLGSFLAIVENMGFVADVKSLIFQLGCIPGALLSDYYTTDEYSQSIGIPTSLGASYSADLSGNIKMTNSNSFISDSCNQQSNSSQASRLAGESSDSVERQVQICPQITDSTFQTHTLTQTLAKPHASHCRSEVITAMKPSVSLRSPLENGFTGAIEIPPNLDTWMKQQAPSYNSRLGFNHETGVGQSGASYSSLRLTEQHISSDSNLQDHVSSNDNASDSFVTSPLRMTGVLNSMVHKNSVNTSLLGRSESNNSMTSHPRQNSVLRSFSSLNRPADISLPGTHMAGFGPQNADSFTTDLVPITKLADHFTPSHMFSGGSHQVGHLTNNNQTQIKEVPRKQMSENDLFQALNIQLTLPDDHTPLSELIPGFFHGAPKHKSGIRSPRSRNVLLEDSCGQHPSGDDLFDIFGVDFKNKLFNGNQNSSSNGSYIDKHTGKDSSTSIGEQGPGVNSIFGGISESIVYSGTGSDHLLDAVVSKVHLAAKQSLSDNVSCKTTLTNISGCTVPSTSPTFNRASMFNQISSEVFCHPKTLGKAGIAGSSSFGSGCSKDDAGNCSQTSSIYGSQISSWVEQGNNVKRDTSISSAYSKRPEEMSKSNRKKLKPGENPRPRPKDRQMIQDRVKELREIVPNGAKCSIDALLERTIKHMLFLQSVTKHADKLKQTGESKIISKEGGLLLKDNFEGGATWAFEVGSQSMVCPIIVEDLNPPRQMLVEMLCEERGFFLEIADIIRGLGLTILKGVMEARNEKIWARFVVEANRDVTRMEIFISLVGLLEQTVKRSAASANCIDNDNMMVHHSFHQAIPATDRPGSLQ